MRSDKSYQWYVQCLSIWLGTFLLLNVSGLVGARFLEQEYISRTCTNEPTPYDVIPGIWKRWDSCYYLDIASYGYATYPESAGFFPLYPLLIAILHRYTGASAASAGMIISNAACLISLFFLYKIARIIKDDHVFALRSVLAMLLFPTSFFFFAIYAESLYLLFALAGVYLLLRSKPSIVATGLALGVASIARPIGWLLDVVLMIEFVRRRNYDVKSFLSLGLGLILSVLGVALYVYYLYVLFGTFTAIPEAQAHWNREWQFPWSTYWGGLMTLATPSLIQENWFLYAMNALDLTFSTLAACAVAVSFIWAKRNEFSLSLSVYSALALAFFLTSQNEAPVPLWGMSRWVAALFPMYIVLGNIFKSTRLQILYFTGSALLLIFFTAWWTSGRWIG